MRVTILAPCWFDSLRAFVHRGDALPNGMGGYNVASYIHERVRRGMPTDVVTLIPDQSEPIRQWQGDVLRIWTVHRRLRGLCRDLYRQESELLARAINESNSAALHVNWTYEYALGAVRSGRPFLLTAHDHALRIWRQFPVSYAVNFFITLYVVQKATLLCGVAPNVASFLSRITGRKACCIPNCFRQEWIDESESIRSAPGGGAPVITSALGWSRIKNVKNALRSFRGVKEVNKHMAYKLMGPGLEPGGAADQWARRHDLVDGVCFMGNLPHRECLKEIQGSDLYFHPSVEEACPGPVCEALLYRTPVVAAKEAPGNRFVLAEGVTGRLVTGKCPQEMVQTLLAVAGAPPDARELDQRRSNVLALCNPDRVLAEYQALYEKL